MTRGMWRWATMSCKCAHYRVRRTDYASMSMTDGQTETRSPHNAFFYSTTRCKHTRLLPRFAAICTQSALKSPTTD